MAAGSCANCSRGTASGCLDALLLEHHAIHCGSPDGDHLTAWLGASPDHSFTYPEGRRSELGALFAKNFPERVVPF